MVNVITGTAGRAVRAVRTRGVRGAVRETGTRIRHKVYLREAHAWAQLDLTRPRPQVELPEGFRFREVGREDLGLIDELPSISLSDAEARHLDGARLFVVEDDAGVGFGCWVFRGTVPAIAGRGGVLRLRPSVRAVEDSVTAPAYRKKRLALGALCAVGDLLQSEGHEVLVTKMALDNIPIRRAVSKVGFREVADMFLLRVGPFTRVRIDNPRGGEAEYLRQELTR